MFTTTETKPNAYAAAPTMYYKMKALFGPDPEMAVKYDHETSTVNIIVVDEVRADALSEMLPSEYDFGDGEVLHVRINGLKFEHSRELDEETVNLALGQNPYFAGIESFEFSFTEVGREYWGVRDFLMFKNTTIPFKADNFGNPEGYCVKTPEQLATSVFELPGLFITTKV